jgi:hypothetical protein
MKNAFSLSLLLLGLCLSVRAGAQASTTLQVTTDMDCNWSLDGHPMGLLQTGDSKIVPVSLGEHRIRAATPDGVAVLRTKVEAFQGQTPVDIQLEVQHEQQLKVKQDKPAGESEKADASPTWTDPATGLMWARMDNGSDVNWNQATEYCSKLQLAGGSDWRLPTVEALKAIYDPDLSLPAMWDAGEVHVHVKGNLRLSGWIWSSSQGDVAGVRLVFPFTHEQPIHGFPLDFSYNTRALCVRYSGE